MLTFVNRTKITFLIKKYYTLSIYESVVAEGMIKNRHDMTQYLIHWCKSDDSDYDEAFQCLLDIVISEKIIGSTHLIKGKHQVICFSEAPIKE